MQNRSIRPCRLTEVVEVVHVLLTGVISVQRRVGGQGHVLQRLPDNRQLSMGHRLRRQPLRLWSVWGTF